MYNDSSLKAMQKEANTLTSGLKQIQNGTIFNGRKIFGKENASWSLTTQNTATATISTLSGGGAEGKTVSYSASSPVLTSNTASNTISPQSDIELTVMQGANSGLTEDIVVLNGSVQVGSGAQIITKGKTLEQIAKAITAQGNVKASIQDGKFTVKSENGEVNINATGDFARITGIGSYTVQSATTTNTSAQNVYVSQGSAAGLTGSEWYDKGWQRGRD